MITIGDLANMIDDAKRAADVFSESIDKVPVRISLKASGWRDVELIEVRIMSDGLLAFILVAEST